MPPQKESTTKKRAPPPRKKATTTKLTSKKTTKRKAKVKTKPKAKPKPKVKAKAKKKKKKKMTTRKLNQLTNWMEKVGLRAARSKLGAAASLSALTKAAKKEWAKKSRAERDVWEPPKRTSRMSRQGDGDDDDFIASEDDLDDDQSDDYLDEEEEEELGFVHSDSDDADNDGEGALSPPPPPLNSSLPALRRSFHPPGDGYRDADVEDDGDSDDELLREMGALSEAAAPAPPTVICIDDSDGDDDDDDDEGTFYWLEHSKSGAAGCRSCGGKIAKGVVRVAQEAPSGYMHYTTTKFQHLECAVKANMYMWCALRRHTNAKDVPGFASLDESGREAVLKLCHGGGGGINAEDNDDDDDNAVMEVVEKTADQVIEDRFRRAEQDGELIEL